jgi:hypothetical protein
MSTHLNQAAVAEPDLLQLLERTAGSAGDGGDGGLSDDQFKAAFREACRIDADTHDGEVHPSRVNKLLRERLGEAFNSRQLSGAWAGACSKNGFLDNTKDDAPIDPAVSRGNGNKTVTLRRWRTTAA